MKPTNLASQLRTYAAHAALIELLGTFAEAETTASFVISCERLSRERAKRLEPLVNEDSWVTVIDASRKEDFAQLLSHASRLNGRLLMLVIETDWGYANFGSSRKQTSDRWLWDIRLERRRTSGNSQKFRSICERVESIFRRDQVKEEGEHEGERRQQLIGPFVARWVSSRNSLNASVETLSLQEAVEIPESLALAGSATFHAHLEARARFSALEDLSLRSGAFNERTNAGSVFCLRPEFRPDFSSGPLARLETVMGALDDVAEEGAMISVWGIRWKGFGGAGTVADALDLVKRGAGWDIQVRASIDLDLKILRSALRAP